MSNEMGLPQAGQAIILVVFIFYSSEVMMFVE